MLGDGTVFKKVLATGEEQIGRIASQLVSNEKFVSSLQVAVTRALEAKGALDRQVSNALAGLHVPTIQDVQKLNDRLDELERIFESLSAKVDVIAEKFDERK
jgi:polyhydroxyalkanoate synthesis regulator phasin